MLTRREAIRHRRRAAAPRHPQGFEIQAPNDYIRIAFNANLMSIRRRELDRARWRMLGVCRGFEVTMHRLCWTLCLLLMCACGDDDGDGGEEPAAGAPSVPDGGYPPVPCPPSTPEFRINLEAEGEDGNVVARVLDADHIPPRQFQNDWTVEFNTPDGETIDDLELVNARPFMPVHNHDGFYAPTVQALDDPGQFQVDDLNLWMIGPWEVQLMVESESAGSDYIVFDVCVD
jgi:hypothetical protein